MPSNEAATIDSEIAESQFCSQRAKRSIRITCYGSSSAKTPVRYLTAASNLGYTLAKRGHICVNGAGSYGCMAAMNDGAVIGNGHIIGVIHEMFVVDNWGEGTVVRDGGAHTALMKSASNNQDDKRTGPIREILVAGGSDLQQRKRLLVEKAEGLVVLPGGPGTWDELWEMACARNLGLVQLPIVCVNVDNYYQPFQVMLQRAYDDGLVKSKPEDLVHFAYTVEEAVRWIEAAVEKSAGKESKTFDRRSSELNRSSFYSPPLVDVRSSFLSKTFSSSSSCAKSSATFLGGVAFGLCISYATSIRPRPT